MRTFTALVLGAVAWGALSFAAVYPWAYWPLAVASGGLGGWAIWRSRRWRPRRPTSLEIALLAIVLGMAIQLVPLPLAMFTRIQPAADRFLSNFSLLYNLQPPAWHPLSIDPAQTAIALGLAVGNALLLAGLVRLSERMDLEWLADRLAWFGLGLTLLAFVQKALAAGSETELVYGVWHPVYGGVPFGPFINRNHFAGWMAMLMPLVMAYSCGVLERAPSLRSRDAGGWIQWVARPAVSQFLFIAFSVLVMGTGVALTRSRSGILGFAVALLVLAMFMWRRAKGRGVRVLAGVYVVSLILGAVVWAGAQATVSKFSLSESDLLQGRLPAWHDTMHIVSDFPVFGSGMGTYGTAMLLYQTGDRTALYQQSHNDYVQLLAEGGLLVVIPAVWLIGLAAARIRRRLASADDPMRSWLRVGAIAGLAGIATQSLVDFTLQMPGVRPLFVLLLAIALHRSAGPRGAVAPSSPLRRHHAHRV